MKLIKERIKKIIKYYPELNNLIFDNWRGWRFIFDSPSVKKCDNKCQQCLLYVTLKKIKIDNEFYPANIYDKKIFGQQNFLNCKTIDQYIDCYINFLNKKCQTKKEIEDELKLITNSKIVFSKNGWDKKKFITKIINKILKISNKNKRGIILNYLSKKID